MTEQLTALNPTSGATLATYATTTEAELDRLLDAAVNAPSDARWRSTATRAGALTDLAGRLRQRGEELVELAHSETGLSVGRLSGELERTCRQIEMFVELIKSGDHLERIIEYGAPHEPTPRPDLRRLTVPLGPVAIFAASNFPFFLSVAGGDTISAPAAGCPVLCKAHPGHPGTSQAVADEVQCAIHEAGLPRGSFALVQMASIDLATSLVTDDRIEAIGFTESLAGGRAIFDAASRRPRPIPVFAEMGSVNPVVVSSPAIRDRGDLIAEMRVGAITREAGQLCTKPGLIFVPDDADGQAFVGMLTRKIATAPAAPMLGPGLLRAIEGSVEQLQADVNVTEFGKGLAPEANALAIAPQLYRTTASAITSDPSRADERFGPVAIVATYGSIGELLAAIDALDGQLTGTVHIADDEPERGAVQAAVEHLLTKIGRLIVNGVPTGVAVTPAQFHGGPYPAGTMSATTSVGTLSIRRYMRPVVFQDAPSWLLPAPLRD